MPESVSKIIIINNFTWSSLTCSFLKYVIWFPGAQFRFCQKVVWWKTSCLVPIIPNQIWPLFKSADFTASSMLHFCTMGPGSEKIDLSPSKSWDTFQNDQHNLHFTLDIAVSEQEIAEIVKLGKTCANWLDYYYLQKINEPYFCHFKSQFWKKCVWHYH